jgi:membrane protein
LIAGGVDWGEVGVGLGAVGLGVTIAATPIGWLGGLGAAAFAGAGGYAIGDGLFNK